MEKIIAFFKDATSLLIVLAIIAITIAIFNLSKGMSSNAKGSASTLEQNVVTGQFAEYDGAIVSGADVINAIRLKASKDCTITVITKMNDKGQPYNDGTEYKNFDVTDKDYIEPTAQFEGQVNTSDNKAIKGVTFTQQ